MLSLAAAFASVVCCAPQTTGGRYVYVVTCGARVDKLDSGLAQKLESADLTKAAAGDHVFPEITGALNGCLTYEAVYDARTSTFYTISPVEPSPKADGTRDYRLLQFSIPALRLIRSTSAGTNQADPPHLLRAAAGVKTETAAEWSPRTDLDLSGFGPEHVNIRNQILETSGHVALLEIFTASPNEPAFAVADVRSRTLTRLSGVPSTVAPDVHLAPGGQYVLIEETAPGGAAAKTGRIVLFDAVTGKDAAERSSPQIRQQYFLTMVPYGKAVYHSGGDYSFIDLGRTFGTAEVSRPIESAGAPSVFFADR